MPVGSMISRPTAVFTSWKAGRETCIDTHTSVLDEARAVQRVLTVVGQRQPHSRSKSPRRRGPARRAGGQSSRGPQIPTSEPMIAPIIRSDRPRIEIGDVRSRVVAATSNAERVRGEFQQMLELPRVEVALLEEACFA
jgi:hypothetical protein